MLDLTTNPGFEDLALAEFQALAVEAGHDLPQGTLRPEGLAGHVSIATESAHILPKMRSIHRAVREIRRFELDPDEPLEHIKNTVAAYAPYIPELVRASSFRVTSKRTGTHPFTSEDVQRIAGAGVRATLDRAVSLREFDVELRCDVRGSTCRLGVQINRRSLSHRSEGPYTQRTSLRANVAWCLLQLACPESAPNALLDPFCGAGTILTEAGRRWPQTLLFGGDRNLEAVEGTRANLQAAQLTADVRELDARDLAPWGRRFDAIVANPPFGKRLGSNLDLPSFYAGILASTAAVATPDARMVLLVHKRHAFNRALGASPWSTRHVRVVELGGMYVGVFVLGLRSPGGG